MRHLQASRFLFTNRLTVSGGHPIQDEVRNTMFSESYFIRDHMCSPTTLTTHPDAGFRSFLISSGLRDSYHRAHSASSEFGHLDSPHCHPPPPWYHAHIANFKPVLRTGYCYFTLTIPPSICAHRSGTPTLYVSFYSLDERQQRDLFAQLYRTRVTHRCRCEYYFPPRHCSNSADL